MVKKSKPSTAVHFLLLLPFFYGKKLKKYETEHELNKRKRQNSVTPTLLLHFNQPTLSCFTLLSRSLQDWPIVTTYLTPLLINRMVIGWPPYFKVLVTILLKI